MTLFGIVAVPGFKLLEETHHSGRPKSATQSFEARPPNLIQCHSSNVHFPTTFLNHVRGFSILTLISFEQQDAADSS
jgi:hypothetical protein